MAHKLPHPIRSLNCGLGDHKSINDSQLGQHQAAVHRVPQSRPNTLCNHSTTNSIMSLHLETDALVTIAQMHGILSKSATQKADISSYRDSKHRPHAPTPLPAGPQRLSPPCVSTKGPAVHPKASPCSSESCPVPSPSSLRSGPPWYPQTCRYTSTA